MPFWHPTGLSSWMASVHISTHLLLYGLSARRCPMSTHFLTRWISRLLVLALVSWAFAGAGVHRLSLLPSMSQCFSIHSSSPAIHSCFFFMTDVSAPIDRPFAYSLLGEFLGLERALVHDVVVPEAKQGCA